MNLQETHRLYWPKKRPKTPAQIQRKVRDKVEEAYKRATRILILAHGPCNDGIAAVAITKRLLGSEGIGVAYLQPRDVAFALDLLCEMPQPRELQILDLSMQPNEGPQIMEALRTLKTRDWDVTWRDHHHKQWEDIDRGQLVPLLLDFALNEDGKESGASLQYKALQHLASHDPYCGKLAALVRDRDVWINEDPDSAKLELAGRAMRIQALEDAFVQAPSDAPKALLPELEAIADEAQSQAEADVQTLFDAATLMEGAVTAVYGWLPTNIGLHKAIEQGAKVALSIRPNGAVSIRAAEDTPVAQIIAKQFSGGGHPCASGMRLPMNRMQLLVYNLRRGRVGVVDRLLDASAQALEDHA